MQPQGMEPNYGDVKADYSNADVQPTAPNVMMNTVPAQVETNIDNNLGGNVQATSNTENGVTTFSSPFNLTALIVSLVSLILCSVSLLLHTIATLLFSKSKIQFDDNNRVITIATSGAIIPIPKGTGAAGYDEVQDFVVKVVPGVQVNHQPVATVNMTLKNGGDITCLGATPVHQAQLFATQLKNHLAARVTNVS